MRMISIVIEEEAFKAVEYEAHIVDVKNPKERAPNINIPEQISILSAVSHQATTKNNLVGSLYLSDSNPKSGGPGGI